MARSNDGRSDDTSSYGEQTRAVVGVEPAPLAQQPDGLPVYRTAAFGFADATEYAEVLGGRRPGYSYSRIDNPTADAFAAGVAALEAYAVPYARDVVGQPFTSGMAAISTTLMAYTHAGAHVVAATELYGGTYAVLRSVLSRFGVETTFVDASDADAVRAAITDRTTVVWAETLANPTMSVADLPALAAVAHDAGARLIVDSTFATPAVCRPLQWGADAVVHSATKYIGGHADATGGVVVGAADVVAPVRAMRTELGGSLAPDEAFLLHRGLATLPLRMERHCATALAFAEAMQADGRLVRVDYPGLPSHRHHALAGKLFDTGPAGTRYGAVVTITPRGGRAAGMALCDALRVVRISSSLGSTHSKVSHIASTTHRQLDDAALAAAGIDPGAVRVSIGLEDVDDLVSDVRSALDALG
jgi:O-acetylhomoserine/O-acetylserine sulfhydrylase-like pyridoxal-dependent enzyme